MSSCSKDSISESNSRWGVNGTVIGMKISSSEKGMLSWTLESDSLVSWTDDTNDVYGIKLFFFDASGGLSSTIAADSGRQVVANGDLSASGDLLINIYENGFIKWRIDADSVWQKNRQRRIDIFELNMTVLDSTGKEIAFIKSDSGTYFLNSRDLRASGNLVVTLSSGANLTTDSLYYSEQSQTFNTNGRIVYVEKDNSIEGVGFECDKEMKNIRVFNAVSGKIKTDEI
ncbi:LPS export ABC transporter periplasmic protein LptC [candidate division WOR-3 bacterium]|nr:LPS export ABC transporter periplasmic protein LptC [candidate division WOR-3 bacterium]